MGASRAHQLGTGTDSTPLPGHCPVFTCVGALAILDRLDLVDRDTLGWWLAERQLPGGGLNGRPEKLPDVCYSWWELSAMAILGKLRWINREKLADFILEAQDLEGGGIGDRPGDWVDVFHTNFGLCGESTHAKAMGFALVADKSKLFPPGLSLLGYPGLQRIDPVYCMPADLIERMGLKKDYEVMPPLEGYEAKLTTKPRENAP